MRNRAFTLIELLVVIAIIAILASIAMPAYRAVQEKANGTKDANNMRQLGIGFAAYLNDHDDTMFSGATSISGSTNWASSIGPGTSANYVADAHTFQSPFDRRTYNATNLSYGMNSSIVPTPPNDASNTPVRTVTSYTHPSALCILGPCNTKTSGSITYPNTMTSDATIGPNKVYGVLGNPGGTTTQGLVNVLYGDWHVAAITMANFNVSSTYQLWSPITTSTQ